MIFSILIIILLPWTSPSQTPTKHLPRTLTTHLPRNNLIAYNACEKNASA